MSEWLSERHQELCALPMAAAVEYIMAAPLPDANQTPSSPPEANNGPSSSLASGGCRFRPGRPLAIQPGRVRRWSGSTIPHALTPVRAAAGEAQLTVPGSATTQPEERSCAQRLAPSMRSS